MPTLSPSWISLTRRFPDHEIIDIQTLWENHFDTKLVPMLLACDPIVTLRILAEILLHLPTSSNLNPNFQKLLENEKLSVHWAEFVKDAEREPLDLVYTMQIMTLMQGISPELAKKQALEVVKYKPDLLNK